MRYCDVIVDIAVERVDRLYTYALPAGMPAEVGCRVKAPFGNREIEGYVLAIKSVCDLPEGKVRFVTRLLEGYPVVDAGQVALAYWMREKYHCTLSEALRQMIPSQMRGERVREKTVRVARLLIEMEPLSYARAPKQAALVEALKGGPLPVPILAQRIPGAAAALKQLEKKGIVCVEEEGTARRPYADLPGARIDDPLLTRQQALALATLRAALTGEGGNFLLLGVTGSGKTEVYIRLIREALALGRAAIVLVPEIALTPQMVDWFRARFGGDAAVIHSRLSPGERFDEWRRIRSGAAKVVIGARSAVFAPVQNLGVVVVDEEHENSYRSDRHPRYDAREVARFRVTATKGVLLLGSATPSIASFMRTMPAVRPENRLTLLELSERARAEGMPTVELVDMRREWTRGNASIFSAELQAALGGCLEVGEQAILFINRRGFSSFVSCRECGQAVKCDSCDVTMTYHQAENRLICHYCGAQRPLPDKCPSCGSAFFKHFGAGTERVEAEVKKLFPEARTLRMDVDTTRGKDAHEKLLSAFRRGEAQVLIGTQMIAKGLDFPRVTLVGVVAADMTLNLPDYRSPERTFQLITQVAGRAGRAERPGRVIVQTYDPDHYAVALAAKQDYRAFYHEEARRRRICLYPPFTILARLLFSAREPELAKRAALAAEKEFNAFLLNDPRLREDVVQMRALEAPIKLLRGDTRWQVFIKLHAKGPTEEILAFMEEYSRRDCPDAAVEMEVNPANML